MNREWGSVQQCIEILSIRLCHGVPTMYIFLKYSSVLSYYGVDLTALLAIIYNLQPPFLFHSFDVSTIGSVA